MKPKSISEMSITISYKKQKGNKIVDGNLTMNMQDWISIPADKQKSEIQRRIKSRVLSFDFL